MSDFFSVSESEISGLKDKVAIITGGSFGIGFATAKLFLSKGAQVVIADLRPPKEELPGSLFLQTDVTKWRDLKALFKQTLDIHRRIDIVFANAGVAPRETFVELMEEGGELVEPNRMTLDVNLTAATNTVALGIHYMKKQKSGGSIVMTSSAVGMI